MSSIQSLHSPSGGMLVPLREGGWLVVHGILLMRW